MFIKPYKMRLVVAVICMALTGASNVVVPWLIKDVIDKVLANKDIYTLNLIVIGILVLFLLRGFFYFGHRQRYPRNPVSSLADPVPVVLRQAQDGQYHEQPDQ